LKPFFKYNSVYLFVYVLILFFVGNILLNNGKVQIHQAMIAFVAEGQFDVFFKYITHLGDGLFAFVVAIIYLFFNVRVSIYIIFSYLGAGIVSLVLKHLVFPHVFRPHHVFDYYIHQNLREIEGVEFIGSNSFPSGHSLSAFALFFCLLFISRNHFAKATCFVFAILAAYSRVYLSQHWLVDIYVGSIIGVLFSMFFYFTFFNTQSFQKLNTTLIQLLSKNKHV
jgi:membrane-associated phospholipid phosphatase